jgi:hypothetical protein
MFNSVPKLLTHHLGHWLTSCVSPNKIKHKILHSKAMRSSGWASKDLGPQGMKVMHGITYNSQGLRRIGAHHINSSVNQVDKNGSVTQIEPWPMLR